MASVEPDGPQLNESMVTAQNDELTARHAVRPGVSVLFCEDTNNSGPRRSVMHEPTGVIPEKAKSATSNSPQICGFSSSCTSEDQRKINDFH